MRVTSAIAAVCLLVIGLATATGASTVWNVSVVGAEKVYTYTYTNTEEGADYITGFHVYAPVTAATIVGSTQPADWTFNTTLDYTGALDIYWEFGGAGDGIAYGSPVTLSFRTPATVNTVEDYVLPDYVGNWGYDTLYAGGTWTMYGSVPVPSGGTSPVPEPSTLAALLAGGLGVLVRRRH